MQAAFVIDAIDPHGSPWGVAEGAGDGVGVAFDGSDPADKDGIKRAVTSITTSTKWQAAVAPEVRDD